ncbi:hypothetical protein F383_36581 [Gossypium arboreum]|uniref:Uncharacterized protein n=1 Tax=Gossypium arboreum TaxID=29729 RepID=A0A0B0MD11_GOSAR|nr:hypothetical protein F383_36581 [Gossypium arboreum]
MYGSRECVVKMITCMT